MEIIFDRSECPVPRFCPVLHGTSFPFGFPSKKTLSPVRYRGKVIDPLSPEGRGCGRFHIVCQNIRCLIWVDSTSVSTIGYAAIFFHEKVTRIIRRFILSNKFPVPLLPFRKKLISCQALRRASCIFCQACSGLSLFEAHR